MTSCDDNDVTCMGNILDKKYAEIRLRCKKYIALGVFFLVLGISLVLSFMWMDVITNIEFSLSTVDMVLVTSFCSMLVGIIFYDFGCTYRKVLEKANVLVRCLKQKRLAIRIGLYGTIAYLGQLYILLSKGYFICFLKPKEIFFAPSTFKRKLLGFKLPRKCQKVSLDELPIWKVEFCTGDFCIPDPKSEDWISGTAKCVRAGPSTLHFNPEEELPRLLEFAKKTLLQ